MANFPVRPLEHSRLGARRGTRSRLAVRDARLRTDPLPPGRGSAESLPAMDLGIVTVRRVDTAEPLVALTFDDGPDPKLTQTKLEVLKSFRAASTFFVLGETAAANPVALRAIPAAGSELANHSYNHPYLTGLGQAGVESQLQRTREVIDPIAPEPPRLFRPPYGAYNQTVLSAAEAQGYRANVLWDVDPSDYQRPPATEIARIVLGGVGAGSIVVMHDWVKETATALPTILEGLKARGLRTVTVSALLSAPVVPVPCRVLRVESPLLRGTDVREVQQALAGHGFDPGPLDGVYGNLTAGAVRRLENDRHLPVTGVVDQRVYHELGIECAGR